MRITHRMIANTVNFNLQSSLNRLEQYSNQLSTGKAFHKPSQNPVGVGRVMGYSASIDRNEQYRMNMNQSKSWLENSEDALHNGLDVMQRIRELAIHGANESLTAEDRRAIAPEVLEFIDHLIGAANTESNGLYIFGGHQTAKEPFVRHNVYGIKEHYLEQTHQGHATFDAGGLQVGTENREIGLEFVVDGEKYSVSAFSGGADRQESFENIKAAVEGHSKLGQHFSVDGDHNGMVISRATPGDFTIEAVTAEGWTVIDNLDEGDLEEVLSADQNIESLSAVNPNSFLSGDYSILTEDTDAACAVDSATRFYQYSQSGDNLVSSVEATTADQNQSASLMVTDVDGDEITFSYQYKEMDPGDGAIATETNTFTVDLVTDPDPFEIDIGENTYELSFNGGEFTAGDRLVINTNAEIAAADEADLVHLHRDGDTDSFFSYAFDDGTLNNDTFSFEFFSLDEKNGALLESSMDLAWGAGTFETSDDPDAPAAGFSVEQAGKGGTFAERTEKIDADGLQNGTYRFEESPYTAEDDFDSDIRIGQQYLQGSAASVLTGSADPDQVSLSTSDEDRNASVLLEVRSIDYDTGEVRYDYTSYEYEMDGTYHRESGTFALNLGGNATQSVNIGNIAVDVDGLD
ncbi:MAG: flagellar hook-associated protein FlgL, partial [Bacillota bacterium]